MNVIAEIHRINQAELEQGLVGTQASWHTKYADSAWVYVGNLPNALTEGDTLCILSQYGEIEDINLVRDEATGKSRGFAFVKYEDARSCVLAVDNLTGSKVLGRSLRVDHCEKYRLPKELLEKEEELAANRSGPGHAYEDKELANDFSIQQGQDLFAKPDPILPKGKSMASKGDKKEDRRKRKEDRMKRRRERDERRERKEERKREKRARRYTEDGGEDDEESKRSKKRKKTERRRDD